jgi:N-acetylneuraminic acid mutarotase
MPYPLFVAEAQGAMIGQSLILVSGFYQSWFATTTSALARDTSSPATAWRAVDDLPAAPGITHAAQVVVGSKLYMCGGYVGGTPGPHTNQCLVYDHDQPTGRQWSKIMPLPDGGRAGGGLVYDSDSQSLIFAAGAVRGAGGVHAIDHNDTWQYSFTNPDAAWIPKAPIPFLGNHISSVTALDSAGVEHHYFFGGQEEENEYNGNNDNHYEYIVAADKWVARQALPFPRGHASASTRSYGCGYLVLGGCTNGGVKVSDVTYYSIATDTWTKIGDLPMGINTPVCDINTVTNTIYCETGSLGSTFSHYRQISL